jgi:hypothetical protein
MKRFAKITAYLFVLLALQAGVVTQALILWQLKGVDLLPRPVQAASALRCGMNAGQVTRVSLLVCFTNC